MSRTAVVTGARRGIGAATAVALGAAGWDTWAAVRDPGDCEHLGAAAAAAGVAIRLVAMDVRNPSSVQAAVQTVLAGSPSIDLVVNNAAVVPVGPAEDLTAEGWQATFETNVLGPVNVIRAVLPAMRARSAGRILNVGSLAGRSMVGPAVGVAYNTSKAALTALSYEWSKELAPLRVRVQIVELGAADTDGFAGIGTQLAALEDNSPYQVAARRMAGFLTGAAAAISTPDVVAAGIVAIAANDEPRVRFVFPAARAAALEPLSRLSDADFLEFCATDSAEAYAARLGLALRIEG